MQTPCESLSQVREVDEEWDSFYIPLLRLLNLQLLSTYPTPEFVVPFTFITRVALSRLFCATSQFPFGRLLFVHCESVTAAADSA